MGKTVIIKARVSPLCSQRLNQVAARRQLASGERVSLSDVVREAVEEKLAQEESGCLDEQFSGPVK